VDVAGIELKATLKAHKLLIPLSEKNAKNTGFAQGTRRVHGFLKRHSADSYTGISTESQMYTPTPGAYRC